MQKRAETLNATFICCFLWVPVCGWVYIVYVYVAVWTRVFLCKLICVETRNWHWMLFFMALHITFWDTAQSLSMSLGWELVNGIWVFICLCDPSSGSSAFMCFFGVLYSDSPTCSIWSWLSLNALNYLDKTACFLWHTN